jgi:hypothetical protein
MNKLISKIIMKIIGYAISSNTKVSTGDIMNSLRINALINELAKDGKIDKDSYDEELTIQVFNTIGGNRNGRQIC